MFEFSIIRKYLIPRRKQLSVSLIALMSILVISLVVWLLLLFLSITEGIEKNWLGRLTALNAPIRIVPTDNYYRSYYYKIDTISQNSNYSPKTIREKFLTSLIDPYNPDVDEGIPSYWPSPIQDPKGNLVDPVKKAFTTFQEMQEGDPSFAAIDYEISGAMLRLQLLRRSPLGEEEQSFLTQVSYLSTFPKDLPNIQKLFTPPTVADINHLLSRNRSDFLRVLTNIDLNSVSTLLPWTCPLHLIPETATFSGTKSFGGIFLDKNGEEIFSKEELKEAKVPIRVSESVKLQAKIDEESLYTAQDLSDVKLVISGEIQGVKIGGKIRWKEIEITEASSHFQFSVPPLYSPFWMHIVDGITVLPEPNGIIIPKSLRENGAHIGDLGSVSYGSFAATSLQEQSIAVRVVGFYDPGLMMVGARPIFAEDSIVQTINAASAVAPLDPLLCNGIQVWFNDLSKTKSTAAILQKRFDEEGISPYWQIKTFYDYDFAKDLLGQFRSDRYLFTLIGLIILIVACTNIISLLLLLVNGKKKEIAILQVLGAKKWHMALIFGLSGALLGAISSIIGTLLGFVTLSNIDNLVRFLSFLQGQEAFHAAFYGSSLPNTVSRGAIWFILITTPLLSLLAGLIPAIKACQFPPAQTLRSE